MAFKKYTQCYQYAPELYPTSKPFNIDDAPMLAVVHVILAFTLNSARKRKSYGSANPW
jgi:hypothetical protein